MSAKARTDSEVAGCGSFVFEGASDKRVQYSVLSSLDCLEGTEYTLTGTGISSAAISPKGQILVKGNEFTFEAFGSMRTSVLGNYGNVRLSGMAEDSFEVRFDEQNGTVSFDGTVPGLVLMTVNGDVSAKSVAITDLDSGKISLTDLAGGTVTVTGKSGNIRIIPVDISLRPAPLRPPPTPPPLPPGRRSSW